MSEQLEQLRRLVFADPDLQRRLFAVEDRRAFVALVLELGAARGLALGAEDVEAALRAAQRQWIERWIT